MDWQQYYPTYKFTERDILLKEYESCAANIQSQERIFLNAANLVFVVFAVLSSLAISFLNNPDNKVFSVVLSTKALVILLVITCAFSILTVRYFADRQKSIIFDSRKIVILRNMLGLDYGSQQLILPNWRIEGATNPFAIKIFPGWSTYVAYPFWLIYITSSVILFKLFPSIIEKSFIYIPNLEKNIFIAIFLVIWTIIISLSFRVALYDTNELKSLSFAKLLATFMHLKLVDDFEYVIYRAKLAMYETRRIKVDLTTAKGTVIFIEDRDFFKHKGVSIKALARALLGFFKIKRRSGGSTITQQLVRTLFIRDMSKTFRRKIVEIILALWFEKICSKEEILEIYLSSVRFEYQTYGIVEARKHFFQRTSDLSVSKAEAFFLIERVSNVRSSILVDKISHTIKQMWENRMLNREDIAQIKGVYSKMFQSGKLKVASREIFHAWLNSQPDML